MSEEEKKKKTKNPKRPCDDCGATTHRTKRNKQCQHHKPDAMKTQMSTNLEQMARIVRASIPGRESPAPGSQPAPAVPEPVMLSLATPLQSNQQAIHDSPEDMEGSFPCHSCKGTISDLQGFNVCPLGKHYTHVEGCQVACSCRSLTAEDRQRGIYAKRELHRLPECATTEQRRRRCILILNKKMNEYNCLFNEQGGLMFTNRGTLETHLGGIPVVEDLIDAHRSEIISNLSFARRELSLSEQKEPLQATVEMWDTFTTHALRPVVRALKQSANKKSLFDVTTPPSWWSNLNPSNDPNSVSWNAVKRPAALQGKPKQILYIHTLCTEFAARGLISEVFHENTTIKAFFHAFRAYDTTLKARGSLKRPHPGVLFLRTRC